MSLEKLRNVTTGEIRDVETNSDEYRDLLNEVYDHDGSARPKWEITGQHHQRRLDDDDIGEEDFGYKHKPIPGAVATFDEIGPEQHPERALTEGEVEAGISSHEEKLDSLGIEVRGHLHDAEPLDRTPVEDRVERGREQAGTQGSSKRSRARSGRSSGGGTKAAGTTSGGSGGSSSGSGGSSSSSGSGSSGSSSSGSSGGSSS